jgi:hypothetical protein
MVKLTQQYFILFNKINSAPVFDSALANTHFLIFIFLVPAQVFMLFLVPDNKIAAGAQKKGRLLGVFFMYSFFILIILMAGPSVWHGYSRSLGENMVIAIFDWVVCIGISYSIRVLSILINSKIKAKPGQKGSDPF